MQGWPSLHCFAQSSFREHKFKCFVIYASDGAASSENGCRSASKKKKKKKKATAEKRRKDQRSLKAITGSVRKKKRLPFHEAWRHAFVHPPLETPFRTSSDAESAAPWGKGCPFSFRYGTPGQNTNKSVEMETN